jgi:hypothetical protein
MAVQQILDHVYATMTQLLARASAHGVAVCMVFVRGLASLADVGIVYADWLWNALVHQKRTSFSQY